MSCAYDCCAAAGEGVAKGSVEHRAVLTSAAPTSPGSQAEASSLALRNSALVSAHTALPYILDPVSPPWLGLMGGGLGWGWGEKLD